MKKTKIEWTEESWNPSIGCTKVSTGCKYCYAEMMAKRLQAMGTKGYENGFEFTLMPERLEQPLKKKKPTKFFVNSMSDLFHEQMPDDFLDKIFEVIKQTPQHVYQILTKREERMAEYFSNKLPPENVWLGVTIEDKKSGLPRIDKLRNIKAAINFLSMEPLLEDLGKINFKGIDWIIVGGESGSNARPMKEEWAINIKRQCEEFNIPFFFKQWGTWGADMIKRNKKINGRKLLGKIWEEYPEHIAFYDNLFKYFVSTDENRPHLLEPVATTGWPFVCASDGLKAIKVPEDLLLKKYKVINIKGDLLLELPHYQHLFKKTTLLKKGKVVDINSLQEAISNSKKYPDKKKCEFCNGIGLCSHCKQNCPKCSGKGTITRYNKYRIKIGNNCFALSIAKALISVKCKKITLLSHEPSRPTLFKCDDYEVMLMPTSDDKPTIAEVTLR